MFEPLFIDARTVLDFDVVLKSLVLIMVEAQIFPDVLATKTTFINLYLLKSSDNVTVVAVELVKVPRP